ncbi:MAG TPA: histidinol-phosphatase HisJ family protein, partial [bacterium (Candidatus Stahlbacteria)]|nr:histidinol-phosphatase HisJ family protein [Candidatus Stahlbacteria bacterium]
LVDYHIHTVLSDGEGEHRDYIEAAKRKNLGEIGFSEHLCLKDVVWTMDPNRIEEMVKLIEELKKDSPINIRSGLEIDYLPGYEPQIEAIINRYSFDYTIGSVHFIGDFNFDSRDYIGEYERWEIYELYKRYFRLIQGTARSGLFDIIGHADVIKKYGFRPSQDISELLIETASVFKKTGVCIEVNTNGLKKPCQEVYPSSDFLKLCFQKGVPITLGSDGHRPEEVGQNFDVAIEMIKNVGYKKMARFEKRKRTLITLPGL